MSGTDVVKMEGGGDFMTTGGGHNHSAFVADSFAANRDVQAAHWNGAQSRDILASNERFGITHLTEFLKTSSDLRKETTKEIAEVMNMVKAEAGATRALIRDQEIRRTELALQDARDEIRHLRDRVAVRV